MEKKNASLETPTWEFEETLEEPKLPEEQSKEKDTMDRQRLFELYGKEKSLTFWAKDQPSFQLVHYSTLEYCVLLVVLLS